MRRFITFGPAVLVLMTVCVALFAAPAAIRSIRVAALSAEVTLAQNTLDRGMVLEQLNAELNAIAEATLPGVAHIEVAERSGWRSRLSNGAGWVYDDAGHIVTNAHVVGEADEVLVELYDGRVQEARVVGTDIHTDVALLKVDPGPGVIPLRRATGEAIGVGDRVFAFGSPFGIKFSMSQGLVSGLGRSEAASFMNMIRGYTNFIQTDAAINPGNSGGPLVDINGRVVGMNAAIANNTPDFVPNEEDMTPQERWQWSRPLGQSAGIGFAIPLETVESVVEQLKDEPDVMLRGYLGVNLINELQYLRRVGPDRIPDGPLRRTLRDSGVLTEFEGLGVIIADTPDGQPAGDAGILPGDVVVSIDGEATPTTEVLRSTISAKRPGEIAQVRVWRRGELLDIPVRLGAAYIPSNGSGSNPEYIPGSQRMTLEEARRAAEG
jgi:S1-C subfamily serine protease